MSNLWNILDEIVEVEFKNTKTKKLPVRLPTGQVSKDDNVNHLAIVKGYMSFLEPGYEFSVVPLIRKLTHGNPDVSQAFKDVIQLANTGHELRFDPKVSKEQQLAMQNAIDDAAVGWCEGAAGLHGIINKMFAQCLVGGAISNEWVPNFNLTTIEKIKFIDPENIRYLKTKDKSKYQPYQKLNNQSLFVKSSGVVNGSYIKLNPATFRYYALLNDGDAPYGIPPYLPSISAVSTQARMLENIDQVTSTMGILGWMQASMEKPDELEGESDATYTARLNQILADLKVRVEQNLRTGVSVGFKDDHEFDFKSTVKDASGMDSLWAHNEQQIASGLDFDSAFMGRGYNSSDSAVAILFTKMVSQLTNIQDIVEANLEYGLKLFLRLRGFNFQSLTVEFNKSTITDDLKYQQGQEIKLRNLVILYKMGTIDEYLFAKLAGFKAPILDKPRIPVNEWDAPATDPVQEDKTAKNKDKSARDTRAKRKQTPVNKTKPVTSKP